MSAANAVQEEDGSSARSPDLGPKKDGEEAPVGDFSPSEGALVNGGSVDDEFDAGFYIRDLNCLSQELKKSSERNLTKDVEFKIFALSTFNSQDY